jgi:hypothetical protein
MSVTHSCNMIFPWVYSHSFSLSFVGVFGVRWFWMNQNVQYIDS